MRSRSAISCAALLAGLLATKASAETVPFNCAILPGDEIASVTMTNALADNATCIVTCNSQPPNTTTIRRSLAPNRCPGKEVEMCRLTSGGDKMVKLTEGRAECAKY